MRLLAPLFFVTLLLSACGSDEYVSPMCECSYDEICVEEECVRITDDIVPAPEAKK